MIIMGSQWNKFQLAQKYANELFAQIKEEFKFFQDYQLIGLKEARVKRTDKFHQHIEIQYSFDNDSWFSSPIHPPHQYPLMRENQNHLLLRLLRQSVPPYKITFHPMQCISWMKNSWIPLIYQLISPKLLEIINTFPPPIILLLLKSSPL